MKTAFFWDVGPCGSVINGRFACIFRAEEIARGRNSVRRLLKVANTFSSLASFLLS
jgi:hypothetical protein